MPPMAKSLTFFNLLYLFSASLFASDLVVEHVANAGVKISSGNRVVLIDAIFATHERFNFLDETEFSQFAKQGADAALVTHFHDDHFGEKRVLALIVKQGHQPHYHALI